VAGDFIKERPQFIGIVGRGEDVPEIRRVAGRHGAPQGRAAPADDHGVEAEAAELRQVFLTGTVNADGEKVFVEPRRQPGGRITIRVRQPAAGAAFFSRLTRRGHRQILDNSSHNRLPITPCRSGAGICRGGILGHRGGGPMGPRFCRRHFTPHRQFCRRRGRRDRCQQRPGHPEVLSRLIAGKDKVIARGTARVAVGISVATAAGGTSFPTHFLRTAAGTGYPTPKVLPPFGLQMTVELDFPTPDADFRIDAVFPVIPVEISGKEVITPRHARRQRRPPLVPPVPACPDAHRSRSADRPSFRGHGDRQPPFYALPGDGPGSAFRNLLVFSGRNCLCRANHRAFVFPPGAGRRRFRY